MAESNRQDPRQYGLPGVRPEIAQSLSSRNSFSTAVTPEFHGLWSDDFVDVTESQRAYVSPRFIERSLILDKKAPNTVPYFNPETREETWVAFNPAEYKQVSGNIETLGNRVVSHVLASRSPRVDFTVDRAAAERGGIHAVTGKLEKLQTYYKGTLNPQTATIHWLQKSAQSPGYAWKDGISVRENMGVFKDIVLQDMLVAMREANDWTPEKVAGIEKVLMFKLFFERQNNQHITNARAILEVADTYMGYKKAVYRDKIAKAEKYIRTHEPKIA